MFIFEPQCHTLVTFFLNLPIGATFPCVLTFPYFFLKCPTIIAFSLLNFIYAVKIQKFFLSRFAHSNLKTYYLYFKHYFDQCRVIEILVFLSLF